MQRAWAAAAETKDCLTKPKEGLVSVTKLSCHPGSCRATQHENFFFVNASRFSLELCETFSASRRHWLSQPSFHRNVRILRRQMRSPGGATHRSVSHRLVDASQPPAHLTD